MECDRCKRGGTPRVTVLSCARCASIICTNCAPSHKYEQHRGTGQFYCSLHHCWQFAPDIMSYCDQHKPIYCDTLSCANYAFEGTYLCHAHMKQNFIVACIVLLRFYTRTSPSYGGKV